MKQLIYFSAPRPYDWNERMSYIDCGSKGDAERFVRFITWDSAPDLAQATWEWPVGTPRSAFAQVADREALAWDRDWEQRGKHEFKRQLYGN